MPFTFLETPSSMTTSVQALKTTQDSDNEVEVIKELEHRGFQGLETLSLEELQALTERKRRQIQLEATENKARLENEIISIDQQIQELGEKKVALTEELNAVLKSMGLPTGGERQARRAPRKNQKATEPQVPPASEA
jgi:uncharacterized protein (DUF342 family)